MTKRSRLSYLWVMTNRSDLTLQGGPNSHDTCKPHWTSHVNCSHHYHDIWTTPTKTRVKGPSRWTPGEPGGDIQTNTSHHSTPRVAGRDSKYRCKAVHSLPVSTTSYFRYVVSTVQSSISSATMVRSSIDTGGGLLSIHFISITNFISVWSPFLFPHWFILKPPCHK